MKRALVCGAGGFIASHLVTRLKREGWWVRGVDLKRPEFSPTTADDFQLLDLRDKDACAAANNRGGVAHERRHRLEPVADRGFRSRADRGTLLFASSGSAVERENLALRP